MSILDALTKLDPKNDAHWTGDGLPAVAAVQSFLGAPVTREQITKAAPGLMRAAATSDEAAEIAPPALVSATQAVGSAEGEITDAQRNVEATRAAYEAAKQALADAEAVRDREIEREAAERARDGKSASQREISLYLERQKQNAREIAEARSALTQDFGGRKGMAALRKLLPTAPTRIASPELIKGGDG